MSVCTLSSLQDTRKHAFLSTSKYLHSLNRLSPLDVEVMKRLGSRVNLIPVIAKADTLTPSDLAKFKQNVSTPIPPSPLLLPL
jgi:septin family protein